MDKPKFCIGASLYHATFDSSGDYIICPECGDTRTLKVILFDGTEYIIDCQGCTRGYDPPTGRVHVYKRTPKVEIVTISGMEVNLGEPVEYRVRLSECSSRILKEGELFLTKEEAEVRAVELAKELEQKEREEIEKKEKPTHSWAWHIHYHRDCIRRAEKHLVHHTDKLNAAKRHVKEKVGV